MATAKAYGVSKILAFDISPSRVEFARKSGADYASLPLTRPEGGDDFEWAENFKAEALKAAGVDSWGVDVVVEASGAPASMAAGMSFVHNGGTCERSYLFTRPSEISDCLSDVQAGLGPMFNKFPTFLIVAKEIDVIGSVRYTAGCFQTAIDLMASGKIDMKPLITSTYPLSKSVEALEAVRSGNDLKVVIMNQQV